MNENKCGNGSLGIWVWDYGNGSGYGTLWYGTMGMEVGMGFGMGHRNGSGYGIYCNGEWGDMGLLGVGYQNYVGDTYMHVGMAKTSGMELWDWDKVSTTNTPV